MSNEEQIFVDLKNDSNDVRAAAALALRSLVEQNSQVRLKLARRGCLKGLRVAGYVLRVAGCGLRVVPRGLLPCRATGGFRRASTTCFVNIQTAPNTFLTLPLSLLTLGVPFLSLFF